MTEETTDETMALTDELAEHLKQLHQDEKDAVHGLAKIASEIHQTALGTNNKYTKEFRDWWKRNRLGNIFRSESNFTQYAKAGDIISLFDNAPNKSNLPRSLSALYAMHRADRNLILRLMQAGEISSKSTAANIKKLTNQKPAKTEFEKTPFAVKPETAHRRDELTVIALKMERAALEGATAAESEGIEQKLLKLQNQIIDLVEASGLRIDVEPLVGGRTIIASRETPSASAGGVQ